MLSTDVGMMPAGLRTTGAGEIRDVAGIVARHVIGVVSAVQHEDVLVREGSGSHAGGRSARLERREGGNVAAHVGQRHKGSLVESAAYGSIGGLQVRAYRSGDFDGGRGRPDLERGVDGHRRANIYLLGIDLENCEPLLGDKDRVRSRRDADEDVTSGIIGQRDQRDAGCRVGELDFGARNGGILLVRDEAGDGCG